MTRLDRVRAFVEERYKDALKSGEEPGVDAQTVSAALSIYRSDASADLNRLWREGILAKAGKRPVRFFPVCEETKREPGHVLFSQAASDSSRGVQSDAEAKLSALGKQDSDRAGSAFATIIGTNGSIKAQIQLAKAAVAYPPCGLHCIIVGESGVGKSLLAEEMWRYGSQVGAFISSDGKTPPFVLFSCADYADNPQLLLSQLFGHAKGAFTGANEEKVGLVEHAEGGVLFLDEIHRLPPTGQELFFTLLDKGTYRRLGETKDRKATVMIIAATTEDPGSTLLATFRRRIPVMIHLPKLTERPPCERLSLIGHFLSQEANRLEIPVWVSGRALQILISYDCKANIGDLKNDLQLCCAKSYLAYLSGHKSQTKDRISGNEQQTMLSIDIQDLPQKVYSAVQETGILNEEVLSDVLMNGFTVRPGEVPTFESITDDYEVPIDLYGFVERRLDSYKHLAVQQEELESTIGRDLERYYYAAAQALHGDDNAQERIPPGMISPLMRNIANDILEVASRRLGRNYSQCLSVALAMHLQQFTERAKAGQIIYNPHLQHIETQYAEEMEAVMLAIPGLSQHLGVPIPEDEAGFLAMFLTQPADELRRPKIGLVVAAHGRATASSMAEVANHILSTNHIRSVDAPLSQSLAEIFEDLCAIVGKCDQGKGVLIVADMGSLLEMEDDLSRKTGVPCRIIPNANTTLVLEAGKVVLTSDLDLDDAVHVIVSASSNYVNSLLDSVLRLEGANERISVDYACPNEYRKAGTRGVIITICPSGAGTAVKIRDMLLENLPIARVMDIVPVSALDNVSLIAERLGKRLRLVVGSIDPGLSGIPYVGIDKVFSKHGLKEIDVLLKGWDTGLSSPELPSRGDSREEAMALIRNQMQHFAPSLEADTVIMQCRFILGKIEEQIYQQEMTVDMVVRICLHTACMFERLATGEPLPMPNWAEDMKQERKASYDLLHLILVEAASSLRLSMSESEMCYFLATLPEKQG